jgi:hypothetical protein
MSHLGNIVIAVLRAKDLNNDSMKRTTKKMLFVKYFLTKSLSSIIEGHALVGRITVACNGHRLD